MSNSTAMKECNNHGPITHLDKNDQDDHDLLAVIDVINNRHGYFLTKY